MCKTNRRGQFFLSADEDIIRCNEVFFYKDKIRVS